MHMSRHERPSYIPFSDRVDGIMNLLDCFVSSVPESSSSHFKLVFGVKMHGLSLCTYLHGGLM
jgi:hypothetical protein